MTLLRVQAIQARHGDTEILHAIDFEVPAGEIHVVLGPSGCGKTTFLRCLAGFHPLAAGRIQLEDRDLHGVAPERRGIVLIHQENVLFPHLTVRANVEFGLRAHRLPSADARRRADELLSLVGLRDRADAKPHQLSGGERQRVSLARALAVRPRLLLMDEPLSNLDQPLRIQLRQDIRRILHAAGTTAIYVTHDRDEALALADRLWIMKDGRFLDAGSPPRVHDQPSSAEVAHLLGRRNLLPYRRASGGLQTPIGPIPLSLPPGAAPEGVLLLEEERLRLVADEAGPLRVDAVEYQGSRHLVHARLEAPTAGVGGVWTLQEAGAPKVGDRVTLAIAGGGAVAWPLTLAK